MSKANAMNVTVSLDSIRQKVAGKRHKLAQRQPKTDLYSPNVKKITNDFGETLTRVDGTIPKDLPLQDGDRFLFISYDQSRNTHNLHKYPAKFFPELPRWLIERYSQPGDNVLDPFCGSATTNLEAMLLGRHSVGVDVDPFAQLLARVKTTPIPSEVLQPLNEQILRRIIAYPNDAPTLIPTFPYQNNWFEDFIQQELGYINGIIHQLDALPEVKDFYRICFSSIIRSVSNADDNCTRTVIRKKLNKRIEPAMALTAFAETLLVNTWFMEQLFHTDKTNVNVSIERKQDARRFDHSDEYFHLAVTSPPYVNAVDYPRTHQLELYWLGLADGSLSNLKKQHVGTETVSATDYKKLHQWGIEEIDNILNQIYQTDPRRAYICYKYLCDMRDNMQEVYRVLKKGGRYVIVVGNNHIRGVVFETWKYLMLIAPEIGFRVENYVGSEIIRHFIKVPREQRIDVDWILVLQK